jgi:hypothetical protein
MRRGLQAFRESWWRCQKELFEGKKMGKKSTKAKKKEDGTIILKYKERERKKRKKRERERKKGVLGGIVLLGLLAKRVEEARLPLRVVDVLQLFRKKRRQIDAKP